MAIEAPFTQEHEMFRRNLRNYVEKELAPHALEWDEAGIFPREGFTGMAEIGALGINYPESVGGAGGAYWCVGGLGGGLAGTTGTGGGGGRGWSPARTAGATWACSWRRRWSRPSSTRSAPTSRR